MFRKGVSALDPMRTVASAILWAVVGATLLAPVTLLAGFYYAELCAILYGKAALWSAILLHWGLTGAAAGALLGFVGRLIDDDNPLTSAPICARKMHAAEPAHPTPAAIARDLIAQVFHVRRHT
jgi:hypothetical protein